MSGLYLGTCNDVKFEVRSFNRFKLFWLTGPLRTDVHTQTHIERKQYLRHSLRSLEGDNDDDDNDDDAISLLNQQLEVPWSWLLLTLLHRIIQYTEQSARSNAYSNQTCFAFVFSRLDPTRQYSVSVYFNFLQKFQRLFSPRFAIIVANFIISPFVVK